MGAPARLGTPGFLVIFAWSLAVIMLTPARHLLAAGIACLLLAAVVHPHSFRRLVRLSWLLMLTLLALPPVFFLGTPDRHLGGLAYSSQGLLSGLQILLRLLVVLLAVAGFTSAVDIASIAGLLERFGLRGLGFSMGVALNLLPSLQSSAANTWHSLWMRGGLRRQRWRGLQLLLLTIITNALRRTEEIALAAEGRAFSPEISRTMPVRRGKLDLWLIPPLLGLLFAFLFVP